MNSVDKDCKLTNGQVAQALSTKAGSMLQFECDSLAPIEPGVVKETKAYSLSCRKVLHCNVPVWQQNIQVTFLSMY